MREIAPGDMWTDVFTAPGKRTTGTAGQTFAIVGPAWHGSLPEGIERYDSPTAAGVLIGRTQTNGKADYNDVHKFQDGIKAVPLSAYGRPYAPPTGAVTACGAARDGTSATTRHPENLAASILST
jgi:hypothetical protein